jgi:putative protein kinase ArgK-like GTPase of G3E family
MPKITKPAASAFMLYRANVLSRVRAQEVLSDAATEEGYKTIWARAKEQWEAMSADDKKKWQDKYEKLKSEHEIREQAAKDKKKLNATKKKKKEVLYAQYKQELRAAKQDLFTEYTAQLVEAGFIQPEALPDDEVVNAAADDA